MARLSLVAAIVSMLSGCLVDDPPPYNAPKQTPARLDTRRGYPLYTEVLNASSSDMLTFTMPVVSEDAGDNLVGYLLLDYSAIPGKAADILGVPQELAASTADDASRVFSMDWSIDGRGTPGCHLITLLVTHRSNLDLVAPNVVNKTDLSEAHWYITIDADPALGNVLVDCPHASTSAPPSTPKGTL